MGRNTEAILAVAVVPLAFACGGGGGGGGGVPVSGSQAPLAGHVLNRAAYGPTPALLDELSVDQAAVQGWLAEQLDPRLDRRERERRPEHAPRAGPGADVRIRRLEPPGSDALPGRARALQRAPAPGAAHRLLGEPLPHPVPQGRPELRLGRADRRVPRVPRERAPARERPRPLRGPARRQRDQPHDADLPRQHRERGHRAERELRPRAARAAHDGRRQRLHRGRRRGDRALLHRVDDLSRRPGGRRRPARELCLRPRGPLGLPLRPRGPRPGLEADLPRDAAPDLHAAGAPAPRASRTASTSSPTSPRCPRPRASSPRSCARSCSTTLLPRPWSTPASSAGSRPAATWGRWSR